VDVNIPLHGFAVEAIRHTHHKIQHRRDDQRHEDERSSSHARYNPHGYYIRNQTQQDSQNQENETKRRFHAHFLEKVTRFPQKLEAENCGEAIGPHDNKSAANVALVKAFCESGAAGSGALVFDVSFNFRDNGFGVCAWRVESCLCF
jgi:hypothetical protein